MNHLYIFILLNSCTAAESGETDAVLLTEVDDDADAGVMDKRPAVELPADRGDELRCPCGGTGDNGTGRFNGKGPFGAIGLICTGGRGFTAREEPGGDRPLDCDPDDGDRLTERFEGTFNDRLF